jgi:hypothetical protein
VPIATPTDESATRISQRAAASTPGFTAASADLTQAGEARQLTTPLPFLLAVKDRFGFGVPVQPIE